MARLARREFSTLLLGGVASAACRLKSSPEPTMQTPVPSPAPLPTVFVGHGSPMNAVTDNRWSRGFQELGKSLPTPKAILCISAHWMTEGTQITLNSPQKTIHDIGGFPQALYDLQYSAPGDTDLAQRIIDLLSAHQASGSTRWGLDHGTWSVLCHTHPAANVPVLQLSLDARKSPAEHLAVGRSLAPLREQGVLILGSGNVTHNLRHAMTQGARNPSVTPDWAARFDAEVAESLAEQDLERLALLPAQPHGRMAHPTAEHYLPLLYVAAAGLSDGAAKLSFPIDGFDMGSIAMRAVQLS